MKKWNEAEIIVVNISETANGKRHMNNENVHGPWENTMHDANHAQANANCVILLPPLITMTSLTANHDLVFL